MTLIFDIAWTHVTARLRQTLVGIFGVATGIGFSVMMAGLLEGSQKDFIRQLVDSMPHISVTDEQREVPAQPATKQFDVVEFRSLSTETERRGIKNPLALMEALGSWFPGAVAPSVATKALIRSGGRDLAVSVIGIDPKREKTVSKLASQMIEGQLDSLYKASNAIILGDGLAEKLGVSVGASLSLATTKGAPVFARVVGLSHAGNRMTDDNQAVVLLKTAQILDGRTALINEIRIRADDVMAAEALANRVERQVGYKSTSWQESHQDILSAFQIRNAIMIMVVGAILLVASFGTYNIISTITHEKTRDIAIMKSVGLRSATVRSIFVLEAAMIGCAGTVIGWILGYMLCVLVGMIEFRSGFTDMTHLPILYAPKHYALAGTVGLLSSLIAGFFPARKAARVQPVDIIRGAS
jgi:lipoprotein-releasing system permease protein